MNENILQDAEWLHQPATQALLKAFSDADVLCRFVGGCVRDTLLGIPVKDIDVATPEKPERVMDLLSDAKIKAIPTGIAHGTVTAVVNGKHFEITTLRRDEETDGRHAKIAFTEDWREDAARRDFTMNALYADANGKLYDYFGGINDINSKHVRFIGDANERIKEDALRILRFFRFNARFGADPVDADGLNACRKLSANLDALSGERIAAEMYKLLVSPRAADMLVLMQDNGILPHIIPGARHLKSVGALLALEEKSAVAPHPVRALATILHTGKAQAQETMKCIHERWSISGADYKRLSFLAAHTLGNINEVDQKKTLRKWGRELFLDKLLIEWAQAEAGGDSTYAPMLELVKNWMIPEFPLTGADLIALGHEAGPTLGKLLKSLEEKWEESGYKLTKEELLKDANQ